MLFATLMTLTAGFVDSVGYVQLGGLYLSFMSGNTTRMGVAIAAENVETAIHAACIIALFVLGAGIGTAIGDRANRFMAPIVYLAETSIFGMVLVGSRVGLGASLPILLATAMGMQNILHRKLWGADIGKGFVTGTLVSMGECLARAPAQRAMLTPSLILGLSWTAFVAGVIIGARVFAYLGLEEAVLLALGVLAAMTLASFFDVYNEAGK